MKGRDLEPFVGFVREIKNPSLLKAEVLGVALEQVLLDGFDHVFDDFLGVTEHHHGLVQVEPVSYTHLTLPTICSV